MPLEPHSIVCSSTGAGCSTTVAGVGWAQESVKTTANSCVAFATKLIQKHLHTISNYVAFGQKSSALSFLLQEF
jgi:hypothetical protein|tara:strand:- start:143 stop:364 length:222 start_codon:yes stop_codon:yes gene_type:complete